MHANALSHLDASHMPATLILRAGLAQVQFSARVACFNDGQQGVARPTRL